MDLPIVYWIDLFCGAGGTSTGIHFAGNNIKVLACVNHDANAIKSHAENHPDAHHFTEDIRDFNVVVKLKALVNELRSKQPDVIINLWASLECTNFSNAKGGQPRDADSRSLANHIFMYLEHLNPDYFYAENVREFMSWGPLCENGKPISRNAGKEYVAWIDNVKNYGYRYDAKILNAADYNSYQSRERLFIQFAKIDFPISWPEQTHTKDKVTSDMFPMPKWKPVRDILDLQDEGQSIFTRKKPLSDKTIQVIIKGVAKAICEKENQFIHKYYGNGDNYSSLKNPSGTATTKDRFAIFTMIFNQYKNGSLSSINTAIGTLTTVPKSNILNFIMNPSHGGHTTSIDRSAPTVIARQDKAPLYLLKAIMDEQGITDIKMRMLKIPELLQIQGFPKDYKLIGNQTEQKKFIGNAVDVNQAKALIACNYQSIKRYKIKVAA
jgi:DNA (cytosine-5)-methyltransferase 1